MILTSLQMPTIANSYLSAPFIFHHLFNKNKPDSPSPTLRITGYNTHHKFSHLYDASPSLTYRRLSIIYPSISLIHNTLSYRMLSPSQVWSASASVVEEQQQVWASPLPPKIVLLTSLSSTAGTHALTSQ